MREKEGERELWREGGRRIEGMKERGENLKRRERFYLPHPPLLFPSLSTHRLGEGRKAGKGKARRKTKMEHKGGKERREESGNEERGRRKRREGGEGRRGGERRGRTCVCWNPEVTLVVGNDQIIFM